MVCNSDSYYWNFKSFKAIYTFVRVSTLTWFGHGSWLWRLCANRRAVPSRYRCQQPLFESHSSHTPDKTIYWLIMFAVWSRHPRFSLSLTTLILVTFVLLNQNNSQEDSSRHSHYSTPLKDNSLPARLKRADTIYNKVLKDRKGLIQKFGPSASDVHSWVPCISILIFAPKRTWP